MFYILKVFIQFLLLILILPEILVSFIKKKKTKKLIRKTRNKLIKSIFILIFATIKFSSKILLIISKKLYYKISVSIIHPQKLSFNDFKNFIFQLSPHEFEIFTSKLYEGLGYSVKHMPLGPDGGKDVILFKKFNKTYVECKHYTSTVIGREICQKLIGAAIGSKNINEVILFTCGKIHNNAIKYIDDVNTNSNIKFKLVQLKEMYNLYLKTNCSEKTLFLKN